MDIDFMKLAIGEALKGLGRTSPNPIVGAVVVLDGEVVGKGYHQRAGGAHAEVNALVDAGEKAKGATIYVTLEPCNHHGRTPPCTQAILKSGIKRVVVGMNDPNPGVTGGGNDFLVASGLEVKCGLLTKECEEINRPFIKHVKQGLPWVILKAGLSIDGKIAARNGHSRWITGESSRNYVHSLRDKVDAILVGIETVLADDPSLTTRLPEGSGRDPVRVILDTHLRFPAEAKMVSQQSASATIIYCGKNVDSAKLASLEKLGVKINCVDLDGEGHIDLKKVLRDLGERQINSLLVEGGGRVHASFLKEKLADEAMFFVAPVFIGADGLPVVANLGLDRVSDAPRLSEVKTRRFDQDIMIEGLFAS